MDRREFATLLPALLAGSALLPGSAEGQSDASTSGLPFIESGVYKPTPGKGGSQAGHTSSHYLMGMLKGGRYPAGNARVDDPAWSGVRGRGDASAQRDVAGARRHRGVDDEWRGQKDGGRRCRNLCRGR
jgi:hypothetical protein